MSNQLLIAHLVDNVMKGVFAFWKAKHHPQIGRTCGQWNPCQQKHAARFHLLRGVCGLAEHIKLAGFSLSIVVGLETSDAIVAMFAALDGFSKARG